MKKPEFSYTTCEHKDLGKVLKVLNADPHICVPGVLPRLLTVALFVLPKKKKRKLEQINRGIDLMAFKTN